MNNNGYPIYQAGTSTTTYAGHLLATTRQAGRGAARTLTPHPRHPGEDHAPPRRSWCTKYHGSRPVVIS
jgi:hypothetical protein